MASDSHPTHLITRVLDAMRAGEPGSHDRLFEMVYDQLRRLAETRMRNEAPGRTLQPTALVHEAYLRLLGDGSATFQNRRHFFGAAATAMRRILIEGARSRGRIKRGGDGDGRQPSIGPIDGDGPLAFNADPAETLALDEALKGLEKENPALAEIVQLRFFAGLTGDEAAEVLGLAPRTVDKKWRLAKAWLARALSSE